MEKISLGIDIGTTNITVQALDLGTGKIAQSCSMPNRKIPSSNEYAYMQDPDEIERSVRALLEKVTIPYSSITVTGQVHGILYFSREGRAVSPLYTWLDRRAGAAVDGETSQQRLFRKTGIHMPSGYGLLAHYANRMLGEVPEDAEGFTSIIDYITGRLTGSILEKTDSSSLAAFGGYDPVSLKFNQRILDEVTGAKQAAFLGTAEPFGNAGYMDHRIPVSFPVGDNQAGFFGMVSRPENTCLISIGTSGQISLFSPSAECPSSMELRPFLGMGYLHVGATLAAGKSYEVIHRFVSSVLECAGMKDIGNEAVFDIMKNAALEADNSSAPLRVRTALNGTRKDPDIRGAVEGIDLENFTLGSLVRGTVDGIAGELYDFRKDLGSLFDPVERIVATGSAVRKNRLFRNSLEEKFGMQVTAAQVDDGAAVGAALIGAVSAGYITLDEKQEIVDALIGN